MNLLDVGVGDVRIVGIYGISGTGKTTLAKHIYNKLLNGCEFEGCCSLVNVRERSLQPNGLQQLQNKLVADITRSECQYFGSIDEGINILQYRFRERKVLILLDDVNHPKQLEALVAEREWFGLGSRIIVTTTNGRILREASQVNNSYELGGMRHDEALELFNRHAFRNDPSVNTYTARLNNLASEIVKATGGLPLALEIIGSFLYGRCEEQWKAMLEKLITRADKEVLDKLRISYDDLEDEYKEIFLDVACFFIGEDIRVVIHMWRDCNFFPEVGIQVLQLRSLIKIGEDKKLWMHDSLRDLGRAIVRQENKSSGKRRRLWCSEEAKGVLREHKKLAMLKVLDLSGCCRLTTTPDLSMFPDLERLILEDCKELAKIHPSMVDLQHLSSLNLKGCFRVKKLPDQLGSMKKLTELIIDGTSICRLPDSIGSLENLQRLSANNCHYLKAIPDSIGQLHSLVELSFSDAGVKSLPDSVGNLNNMEVLNISSSNISHFPSALGKLGKLKVINASKCYTLSGDIPAELGKLCSLEVLKLDDTNINRIPETIAGLSRLQTLDLTACRRLHTIPELPVSLVNVRVACQSVDAITNLPDLISLEELVLITSTPQCHFSSIPHAEVPPIRGSTYLQSLPKLPESLNKLNLLNNPLQVLPELSNLENLLELSLEKCYNLTEIPGLVDLVVLKSLKVSWCPHITSLVGLERLKSLKILQVTSCEKLKRLPDLSTLQKLSVLNVRGCESLVAIQGLDRLYALTELDIGNCKCIQSLPDLSNLTLLQSLSADGCKKLQGLEGLGELEELLSLRISGCREIKCLPNLSKLKRLRHLDIAGCKGISEVCGLLEMKFLKRIVVNRCASLKKFRELPELMDMISSGRDNLSAVSRSIAERHKPLTISGNAPRRASSVSIKGLTVAVQGFNVIAIYPCDNNRIIRSVPEHLN
ncbi:hypothetical protein CRG98_021574 [Punica granatum]|uniref:AAA+ ATPase domain-containing protein n=1 Tax=Punica granatum TaxID=22663 RepID=A0A2I0JNX6_PUNGR|nr:hypothetical protein CRG98_021574 [Punica granatum]